MATLPSYILITPARNEARYIELTLQSMAAQTYRPLKWIIVSDGSTDGTDDLVRKYTADNPWIELLRMPERAERHFAGKVHAFNAGYAKAKELNPDVMGNLDADVSASADRLSGKDRCSTITGFRTSKMSGAVVSCSGGNASTRSVDTHPSKGVASTISRSFLQE
jgi:glycosyltransferase involved in cell wall biosynthesis